MSEIERMLSNEIERTLSLSDDERKAEALDSLMSNVRTAVKQIAISRRTAEITFGISNEKFDKMLNGMCKEAQAKFGTMTEQEMAKFMLKELLSNLLEK